MIHCIEERKRRIRHSGNGIKVRAWKGLPGQRLSGEGEVESESDLMPPIDGTRYDCCLLEEMAGRSNLVQTIWHSHAILLFSFLD